MNVVLTIDGRKAIPVRALHFVAGRRRDGTSRLSPDEIASVAAHQDGFYRAEPYGTYHIVDGVPRPVPFSQWGQFVIRLSALSARLDKEKKQRSYDDRYAQWMDDAIPLLPAGLFVWLDEFHKWYSRTRPLVEDGIHSHDDDGEILARQESDDLDLFPVIPSQLCPCIREGFEEQFAAPPRYERLSDELEGWFDKPLAALPAWQRHRVKADFGWPWDELSEGQRRSVVACWDAPRDPETAAEYEAGFYGFDKSAALAGLTALEAARLLLVRDGDLLRRLGIPCTETDAPPLARKLLTLEEMRTTGVDGTIHPLAEWLRRAREKGIEYLPGLDWAVEHCSHSKSLPEQSAKMSGECSQRVSTETPKPPAYEAEDEPDEEPSPATDAKPPTSSGKRPSPYATTERICEAFPHPKSVSPSRWGDGSYLSDPPEWLRGARVSPGRPGVSALWSPVQFAVCMVCKKHIGKVQAAVIIRREFSDWLDDWEGSAELLP